MMRQPIGREPRVASDRAAGKVTAACIGPHNMHFRSTCRLLSDCAAGGVEVRMWPVAAVPNKSRGPGG